MRIASFFSFVVSWMMVVGMVAPLRAQSFLLQNLKLNKGLSQSTAWAVAQDEKGFLWVGTQDGLNRYDGYEFKVFKHIPFDSTSLSSNFVRSLLADRNGKLWVGTQLEGLNLFDPRTLRAYHFTTTHPKYPIISNEIQCLAQDRFGQIWVGTSVGISRITPEYVHGEVTYSIQHWKSPHADSRATNNILTMMEDDFGRMWIGTRGGVFFIANQTLKQPHATWTQPDTTPFMVKAFAKDNTGSIWWGTSEGLYRYVPSENLAAPFAKDVFESKNSLIESLTIDSRNILWIGTGDGQLMGLKLNGLPYSREFIEPTGYSLENAGYVSHIMEAKYQKGVLWVGTYAEGILKLIPDSRKFFVNSLYQYPNLNTKYVSTIYKDKENLWIGTDKGLVREHIETGESEVFLFNQPEFPPRSHIVRYIHRDVEGNIWVGSVGGLIKMEYINGRYKPIQQPFDPNCKDKSYLYLYEDAKGYLYACLPKSINIRNPQTKEFLPCSIFPDSSFSKESRNRIISLYRDTKARFWMGTSAGLYLIRDFLDPIAQLGKIKPECYKHNPADRNSLRSNTILCIKEDVKGNIWLGTTDGLIRVDDDGKKLTFENFAEEEGLSNPVIYGILEDTVKKNLWLSTNSGLFRFRLKTHRFENYDVNDGIAHNEFNNGATFQAQDGEMLFGGVRGITSFYPSRIKSDSINPKVFITHYTNQEGLQRELLYQDPKRIELDYNDNTISIHFIGIQYADIEDVRYYYAIRKSDESNTNIKWVPLGDIRQVSFPKLPQGEYKFLVTASSSNAEDFKNGNIDSLTIVVSPPFWSTGWFYLLIILGIGSLLWLLHQLRVRQKVARVMDMERVRKNAAADFHDEMGHKLTVISMFASVIKRKLLPEQEGLHPHIDKIINTSDSIYGSMKDLLWVLDPKKDSIYDMALMLKDFGDQLFDKSGIAFRADGIAENMRGYDLQMNQKRHITLMFKEAMNNAAKHAKCANTDLDFVWKEDSHELSISFRDDGEGFDPDNTHSGNGLLNLKDRANKIHAELSVFSEKGAGTKILLLIKFQHFPPPNETFWDKLKTDVIELKQYVWEKENPA